jgi:hypothetical protein
MIDFLEIAWPGLLALAVFLVLIAHAARDHRRRHPRGRYSVRFEGPLGILTAEHELTAQQAAQVAEVARRLVGEPLTTTRPAVLGQPFTMREEGRVLASERDDLIAQGVDPRELGIPLAPPDGYTDDVGMYRSRRHPGRAG